jgi:hypothetical protein
LPNSGLEIVRFSKAFGYIRAVTTGLSSGRSQQGLQIHQGCHNRAAGPSATSRLSRQGFQIHQGCHNRAFTHSDTAYFMYTDALGYRRASRYIRDFTTGLADAVNMSNTARSFDRAQGSRAAVLGLPSFGLEITCAKFRSGDYVVCQISV